MVKRVDRPSQVDYHKPQFVHPSHRPFERDAQNYAPTEYGKAVIADLRERMKQFVNQKPNKEWAQRVLDRHADGEHIFPLGLQWAREVVDQQHGKPVEREPGSDDV